MEVPKSITVIFHYGKNKHCFLTLVNSYQNQRRRYAGGENKLIIYEANLTHNRKAYFSLYGQTPELQSGDTVEITGMYGNKLGVKENEPIPLTPIKSAVPMAKRAYVEPLSPDDWEILSMNPQRMETVIQDQVRVIWPDQVLPVWIHNSMMVFLRIVSVEPVAPCVVLGDSTELDVSSKVRTNPPPKSLSLPSHQNIPQTTKQNQQQQTSKMQRNQQTQAVASPCKSRTKDLPSSSETSDYDNIDTLEPKPVTPSPRMSPRMWKKGVAAVSKKGTNFLSGSDAAEKMGDRTKPMVRRQSSIMESVIRYLFPFGGEHHKIETDSSSDSDAGSAIDYNMQNLPSRNGVLRVQPLQLSCTMEDCFSVGKAEINNQIASKSFFFRSNRSPRKAFETKVVASKTCNIPYELFQPSTIYVDAEVTKNERLLHPYLPHLPHSFIARLQKIPSPQEKADATANPKKKSKDGSRESSVSQSDSKSTGGESHDAEDYSSISGSCYVRVVAIDRRAGLTDDAWQEAADRVLSEQPLLFGHTLIPELLRRQLKLDVTGSVWLHTGTVDLVIPHKVCIFPLSSVPRKITNDMIILAFRNYIKNCANAEHPLVVFQGLFLKIMVFPETSLEIQISFYGEKDLKNAKAVTMLSEMNIDSVLVTVEKDIKEDKMGEVNTMLVYSQASDIDPKPQPTKLKHLGGIEKLAKQAISHLLAGLGARPLSRHTFLARAGLCQGILLITGPKGSGKTALVKGLCRKMSHLPVLAHITFIDCKTLRGKTVANIQRILESVFDEAAWREPAIVVFDNLDVILPVPSGPENEMTGEALYSAKNSEVIQGLIKCEIENNSHVAVIATAKSRSSLHSSLVSSRGIHFIQQTLNIQSPDQDARIEILTAILQHHGGISTETVKCLDPIPIAVKTEGFVARDLESLVNRAVHSKLIQDKDAYKNKVTLTLDDFECAISDFKPVSIRNVKLHKAGELGWEDVGGMEDVKTTLIETLRWPAKYPQLFSSCPLRLRSGILLYGAPGTGKTLLAGAVAKECGLNFISIKGPELLSKYIGASEQAVRDLFTRAMSAKPCILFFDEFDSIAPKRGHDSTGVTDRVVNQLLTQLDGVEGLQGVYVLGATSRPDLLDPALLRPGRLDKCIACHMPDENDRYNILVALTRRMSLASDVDLQEVAEICHHCTGADLKALLYNAQLKAIHEQSTAKQYEQEGLVRIKGNDATCPAAVRRASLILDEAITSKLSGSLSLSASPNTSVDDKSDSLSSPRQNFDFTKNNVQTSTSRAYRQDAMSPDVDLESQRRVQKVESGDGLREKIISIQNQNAKATGEDLSEKEKYMDHEQALEKLNLDFIDSSPLAEILPDIAHKSNSPVKKDGEWSSRPAEARRGSMPEIESSILKDLQQLGDRLGDKISENTESMFSEMKAAIHKEDTGSAFNAVASAHQSKTQSVGHSKKNPQQKEPVMVKVTKSSTSESESDLKDVDPGNTFPPVTGKRKRSYERARSYGPGEAGDTKSLSAPPLRSDLKSPSVDKPVTVFTSLKRGLATLTAEDEARYLAMVKEIQRRDLNFFEAANAKRRTSLPLSSKSSSLLEVCQHHLLEAARTMRPSVSQQEREKYQRIYENFVSSRSEFDKQPPTQVGKRATLA